MRMESHAGEVAVLDVEVTAKAFRALGDPVRLRIVSLLLEYEELTVSQLTEALPVTQPRVSTHLGCLVSCGFASVRREGRNAYYAVSGPEAERVAQYVIEITEKAGLRAAFHWNGDRVIVTNAG